MALPAPIRPCVQKQSGRGASDKGVSVGIGLKRADLGGLLDILSTGNELLGTIVGGLGDLVGYSAVR